MMLQERKKHGAHIVQINVCVDNECDTCFHKSFASHHRSDHLGIDNDFYDTRKIFKGSNKKFIFECDKCPHTFEATPNSITGPSNTWCPYCAHKLLCKKDCQFCFDNSFQSHEKHKFWSPENGSIKPRDVFKSTRSKYKFKCDVCEHTFELTLYNVTQKRPSWCSYCSNEILCQKPGCDRCTKKSFASVPKHKHWSDKNELKPYQVFKNSSVAYYFKCDKCPHTFKAGLDHISRENSTWCPYCASKELCTNEKCEHCHNKSFQSCYRSYWWSTKNELSSREVFKHSQEKYIFECDDCNNEFEMDLAHISGRDSWCSCTKTKTETKLFEWLKTSFKNVAIFRQITFNDCINNSQSKRKLPFDFLLKELNLILELDGKQHFEQVSNWQSPEETQERDRYKMTKALEHGYTVVRLLQEDVWFNKNDWEEKLLSNLKKYAKPTIVYLCNNNEYDCYKSNA